MRGGWGVSPPTVMVESKVRTLNIFRHRLPKANLGRNRKRSFCLNDSYEDVTACLRENFVIKDNTEQVVECLLMALKAKDEYTLMHSIRVGRYAALIASKMNLSTEEISKAYICGLLHDVGKIYVPDSILFKAGALTEEEFFIIKEHPVQSEKICKPIKALEDILPVLRAHHERMDGRGYPDGLMRNEIPLLARIIAVADTLDATTSNRPYQKNMPLDKVKTILQGGAGTQWDADVVGVVLKNFTTSCFAEALMPSWSYNFANSCYTQTKLCVGTTFSLFYRRRTSA